MSRHSDRRVRAFLAVAAFIAVAFTTNVFFEIVIASANARTDSARAQIVAAERALERVTMYNHQAEELNREIATLHLRDTSPHQCAIVISELQRLSARDGLTLMSVLRDAASFVRQRTGLPSDSYAITLEGPYPKMLLALAAFGEIPLVASVKAVTFERLEHRRTSSADVRTSIQLEVFRMMNLDESRSS